MVEESQQLIVAREKGRIRRSVTLGFSTIGRPGKRRFGVVFRSPSGQGSGMWMSECQLC